MSAQSYPAWFVHEIACLAYEAGRQDERDAIAREFEAALGRKALDIRAVTGWLVRTTGTTETAAGARRRGTT